MAKEMYFVTGDEYRAIGRRWADVLRRLSGKGTSLSPQLVLDRLQEMSELPAEAFQHSKKASEKMPPLIKGVFSPAWRKIDNVRRWNEERKWGFTEADFRNLPPPPSFPQDLPFATVVLVPYLETPLKTYAELREVIRQEHWKNVLNAMGLNEAWGDNLFVCGTNHAPGLRWEVINMDGPRFRDKSEFCTPSVKAETPQFDSALIPPAEYLPHAGVLAELAHSPYWARSLSSNGGAAPEIWIPGYTIFDARLGCKDVFRAGDDGKHISIRAYSDVDPYATHREGVYAEIVNMKHRIGFILATPVLV